MPLPPKKMTETTLSVPTSPDGTSPAETTLSVPASPDGTSPAEILRNWLQTYNYAAIRKFILKMCPRDYAIRVLGVVLKNEAYARERLIQQGLARKKVRFYFGPAADEKCAAEVANEKPECVFELNGSILLRPKAMRAYCGQPVLWIHNLTPKFTIHWAKAFLEIYARQFPWQRLTSVYAMFPTVYISSKYAPRALEMLSDLWPSGAGTLEWRCSEDSVVRDCRTIDLNAPQL